MSRQGRKEDAAEIISSEGARHREYMMTEIEKMIDFAAINTENFLTSAVEERKKIIFTMAGLMTVVVILGLISSILIARSIVIPLGIIVERIKNLSKGSLRDKVDIYKKDEIGVLSNSLGELQNDLFQRAQILERIASGDFSADIPPRSEEDDLGKSFFAMTSSLRKTSEELVSSELKYSNLTKAVPIGISVSTLDGRVIEVNPYLVELFGFDSKEEFISYPASEYYYNSDDRKLLLLKADLLLISKAQLNLPP